MIRISTFDDIAELYATRGALHYGEGVTQIEHALQCAALAEADGSSLNLVAAAFLHDIGHLIVSEADVAGLGVDDRHETAGAKALASLFGPAICGPIALHVSAKRYLCLRELSYFDALSAASKRSLDLQGGAFDAAQAAAFERNPHWREAVALRRYDDTGKREETARRGFDDYAPLMRDLLVTGADT